MLDNIALEGYNEYKSTIGGSQQEMDWYTNRRSQDNNVAYAVVTDDGRLHRFSYHICFGKLSDLEGYHVHGTPHAILVQINTNFLEVLNIPEERTHAYFKWLYTQSPFSSCFLNTWEQAMNDGVVAISVDVESSLMAGACSAVRLIWESFYSEYDLPSIVALWYEVVSRHPNVDPTIEFAFCNNLMASSDGRFCFRGSTAGHQFLKSDDFTSVHNFIKNTPTSSPIYRTYKEYHFVVGLWSGEDDYGDEGQGDLNDWMTKRMMGDMKQVNIFMKDHYSTYFTLDQAVAGIVKCVHDYQEERDS
jgi:hypothetical protein